MTAQDSRFRSPRLLWIALAGTIVGLAPLIAVWLSTTVSRMLGCAISEGNVRPCLLFGFDIGGLLHTGFVMGWLFFMTLPLVGIALLLWIILVVRAVRTKMAGR